MIQMFSNNKWQCTTVSKFQYFCSLCLLVMVSFTRKLLENLFSFVSIFSPHLMIYFEILQHLLHDLLKCKNIGKNLLTPTHFSILVFPKSRTDSRIHHYCLLLPNIFLPAMLSKDAIFIDDTRKQKLTEKNSC